MDPTRRWYHHPLVTFIVPLVVLVFSPHLYTFLGSHTLARPYNEAQIQEIATSIDALYTMLADMTFLPRTAIKRGPHSIDTASIPCKRDPAVNRLMELLPYIDVLEMQDGDWQSDANLLDYRRLDHLHEGCDPLNSENGKNYVTPHILGLINWGDIDHRQGVLIYDTYRRALRVQQNIPADVADNDAQWPDSSGVEIFGQAINLNLPTWSFMQYLWATWFDAPRLLKMLTGALRTSKISPWDLFSRSDDWILGHGTITEILHKNGWPDSFSPDNFNADIIRARHAARQREQRDFPLWRRDELESKIYTHDADYYPEEDNPVNIHVAMLEEELATATDEQQQWALKWRLQQETWDLEKDQAELEEAEKVASQVCPNGICHPGKAIILWEYRAVEKEYLKSQDMPSAASECRKKLDHLPEWAPPDADRFSNCMDQRSLKQHWLFVAYTQSKAAALKFCGGDASCLLRPNTLENLAEDRIAELQRDIALDEDRLQKMAAWALSLPPHATEAIARFAKDESGIVGRQLHSRTRVDWIKEQLAAGERWKLWRCLDEHSCY